MAELDPRKYNLTPLMVAAAEGDLSAVNALISAGAKVNARDNRGATALMYAVQNGHRLVTRALLQAGADPRLSSHSQLTAFDIAQKNGFKDLLELLRAVALALEAQESSRGGNPAAPPRLRTHYDNLKVSRDAPPEVIRAAYRSLSQKYHPDRNPGDPDTVRVMAILNAAYEVLSDPVKRKEHDRWIAKQTATPQSFVEEEPPSPTTREPARPPPPADRRSPLPESEIQFRRHIGKWWFAYAVGIALIWWAVGDANKSQSPRVTAERSETSPAQSPAQIPDKSAKEIAQALNKKSSRSDNSLTSQIQRDLAAKPEPLPLPANGRRFMYARAERIAPLRVVTRESSNHFFVKLEDWDSGVPIMGIFIRGGQSIETKVPLGRFRLKYATGTQWFGDANEDLFGPDTGTFQADKSFDFYETGNQISGYTVELFLHPHGNLRTSHINRRNW